jgi:D-aminoacyl-tRNA deacylase
MYKKYLILASKQDQAGMNIVKALEQFRNPMLDAMKKDAKGFDIELIETDIVYDEGMDYEKISKYDFIIFASKHQSEKGGKTLSLHAPGNWISASPEHGGKSKQVCPTSALFQKQTFEILDKNAKEAGLDEYQVTLECTHHGPLIEKPCIFIEIGATETEWEDRRAGFVIAKTINQIINEFEENPHREIAVGIGGPHYCPGFNKIQLNSNIAVSHIIPQYVLPIDEGMIQEAIEKTQEEVDFALVDWKGCGKSEERQRIIDLLEKNYIQWKRTSEVSREAS